MMGWLSDWGANYVDRLDPDDPMRAGANPAKEKTMTAIVTVIAVGKVVEIVERDGSAEPIVSKLTGSGDNRQFYAHGDKAITVREIDEAATPVDTDYVMIGGVRVARRFDFGLALHALKSGRRVAREGWNGAGQFLFLVPGSRFTVNRPPLLGIYPEGTQIDYHPHIDMRNAQGVIVPWLASQGDMLGEDWMIVED